MEVKGRRHRFSVTKLQSPGLEIFREYSHILALSPFQLLPISRCMKYRQVVGIGKLLGGYGWDILCIDVEKEGGQDRSLGNAVSQASQLARLTVVSCKGKASVANKLHNHTDPVLVQHKPQQRASEATVPDNVIGSCQVDKDGTGLLFRFKCILNALREQRDLLHGGPSASKTRLFPWEQRVNKRFDAGADKSLENLVRNRKQGDRTIPPWVLYRFRRLWDRYY